MEIKSRKRWAFILILPITITLTFIYYEGGMSTNESGEMQNSRAVLNTISHTENIVNIIEREHTTVVPESTIRRCKHPAIGNEATSVALLKVHKTGSTTLSSILYRFGIRRGLSFVMMRDGTHQFYPDTIDKAYKKFYPPCQQEKYDILNIHSRYNGRSVLTGYMQQHTYVVATLRHPMEQMRSGFNYYGFAKQGEMMGKTYEDFLDNPQPFARELRNKFPNPIHLVWNSMSYDIGLDDFDIPTGIKKDQIEREPKYVAEVERFLNWAEEQIDFFVFSEYFDESLILLKDRLNWEIEDLVYFTQNVAADPPNKEIDEIIQNKTIEFSYIDYLLYNRMKQQLDVLKEEKGDQLAIEVKILQSLNKNFSDYCLEKSETDPKLYGEVKILGNKLRKERENDRCCYETAIDEMKYVKDIKNYMANSCRLKDN